MTRIKKSCDKCEKKYNNVLLYRGEILCFNCYVKSNKNIIKCPYKNIEPLSDRLCPSIAVTKEQGKFIRNRAKECKMSISMYIKLLIMNDMENINNKLK